MVIVQSPFLKMRIWIWAGDSNSTFDYVVITTNVKKIEKPYEIINQIQTNRFV